MHGLAGSHHQTPIHRPGSGHSDAYTIRAAAGSAALWQTADRCVQTAAYETTDPMLQTRGTPSCPAWTSHRGYRDDASYGCAPPHALAVAPAVRDRHSASF